MGKTQKMMGTGYRPFIVRSSTIRKSESLQMQLLDNTKCNIKFEGWLGAWLPLVKYGQISVIYS